MSEGRDDRVDVGTCEAAKGVQEGAELELDEVLNRSPVQSVVPDLDDCASPVMEGQPGVDRAVDDVDVPTEQNQRLAEGVRGPDEKEEQSQPAQVGALGKVKAEQRIVGRLRGLFEEHGFRHVLLCNIL